MTFRASALLLSTCVCLGLVAGASPAGAQSPAPPRRSLQAVRIPDTARIVVDGHLDESVWAGVEPATDFTQQDPVNGAPATERTEVRIVYNRTTLYMGVRCFDSEPDRLLRFQMRRDEFLPADDRFMWVFDPFLTAQNGYFFETNPSGLMGDSLIGPTGQNRQWDGLWLLRVQRDEQGWSFEAEIPFSTLNFDPKATSWGINFQRTVRRRNEDSLWNGWGRNQGLQRLSNAGLLTGMNQEVSQGLGLDLRPFGVVTSDAAPGTGRPETNTKANSGIDLFYSVTPGLRANFTVRTDFAQTEVDQRQVNLTQFPLFFPEKRTFFLEGASFFEFGSVSQAGNSLAGGFSRPVENSVVPFFSRRIGLDAGGNPQTIDYGAKLTGQIGRRQDVGILQVRTASDNGLPGETFTVLRTKRRFFRQSYVGALYTARDVNGTDGAVQQTVGADFQLATSTFRGAQNLNVGGYALYNTTAGDLGKSGAWGLRADYPNDHWNAGMSYRAVQENFNPAVGFTLRQGYQKYNPYVNLSVRPVDDLVRRVAVTADLDLQTDMQNRLLTQVWNLTALNMDFHTGDTFSLFVVPEYQRLDRDFAIYPGITLPKGSEYRFVRWRATASTANRRLIAFAPTLEVGRFYSGTIRRVAADVTVRARPGVIAYFSGEINNVRLAEGTFTTKLLRVTPEWQLNQWISLVNTWQYDTVSRVLGWQSRFRWIVRPGNDVYVVYSHNWLSDPVTDRFDTLNRRAATKVLYTKRF